MTTITRPNAEIRISVELLRLILDLPSDYMIVGADATHAEWRQEIRLLVEAPALPPVDHGEPRHTIKPLYQRVATGQATLSDIQVSLSPRVVPS